MNNRFTNKKSIKDTRIVVAMSGGVDSSTVAAMLHEEGYQVIGITLQLYDLGVDLAKKGACCAGQDIYDAKTVADKLSIPHYVLNYESLFKQSVIESFADSYVKGETPNPCIMCNQRVKFRDLLKMAKDLNADALVTGHYVRRFEKDGVAELHQAVDPIKDQSYFLFSTTKEQLEFLHFPLGEYSKAQTRDLAKKYGLVVADKPDSQDICFVGGGNYADIVRKLRPQAFESGDIVDINGKVLARHNGIANYTIGQRKGLGLSSDKPLYVIRIDAIENKVVVGDISNLGAKKFLIKDVNWLLDDNITTITAKVKLRSTQMPVEAEINLNDDGAEIVLREPFNAITPGQACVIYDGTRVIGGGWITREIL
jgi:tRNA-uridine 2-sulfurtransferase